MPKNIVICCDGTGNKFCDHNTNVVKLYSVLELEDPGRQVAYYHGGLGTMGAPGAFSALARWWSKALGLAFGRGLTHDIGDAYSFLMDVYQSGDRVYLFGFSRGAYVVRALSGMLHMFGLVRGGDYNLIQYATEMLKRRQDKSTFDEADSFKKTFSRECKPYFNGVWDTVSSVGWVWDPLHIPYTAKNPDLSIGRHAIAIDERRSFFRENLWSQPDKDEQGRPKQDIKQVWFAGVHSDVGGGYAESESGLAKIALEWMLREAYGAGLLICTDKVQPVLERGQGPDETAKMHNSLSDAWMLLEPLPHMHTDMSRKPPVKHWKIPLGARRTMRPPVVIHESVVRRMKADATYRPPNLPDPYDVEPWVRWGASTTAATK